MWCRLQSSTFIDIWLYYKRCVGSIHDPSWQVSLSTLVDFGKSLEITQGAAHVFGGELCNSNPHLQFRQHLILRQKHSLIKSRLSRNIIAVCVSLNTHDMVLKPHHSRSTAASPPTSIKHHNGLLYHHSLHHRRAS